MLTKFSPSGSGFLPCIIYRVFIQYEKTTPTEYARTIKARLAGGETELE